MSIKQRITLALDIIYRNGKSKEDAILFKRLNDVWEFRYFKYNTIPYTLDGSFCDNELMELYNNNRNNERYIK